MPPTAAASGDAAWGSGPTIRYPAAAPGRTVSSLTEPHTARQLSWTRLMEREPEEAAPGVDCMSSRRVPSADAEEIKLTYLNGTLRQTCHVGSECCGAAHVNRALVVPYTDSSRLKNDRYRVSATRRSSVET
jgi:hypothetical protein